MKRFIVDTCIFIDDPDCMFKFEDNEVIIPFKVIEELDKHKEAGGSRGEGARASLRNIHNLSETAKNAAKTDKKVEYKLSKGIKMDHGGILRVDTTNPEDVKMPVSLDPTVPDNAILIVAYATKKKFPKSETVVITNDINLKIKSESIDIKTEKYENRTVKKAEHLFSPCHVLALPSKDIDSFMKTGSFEPPKGTSLYPNQYVWFQAYGTSKQSVLGRYHAGRNRIEKLRYADSNPCGVECRNLEQRFAIDLLMDDDIRLVSLLGKAGTGKTFLALAAAMQKLQERKYSRIMVARPIVTLGKAHDIGFLPGSMQEKLTPWMQPIIDNLEILLDTSEDKEQSIEMLLSEKKLEFGALAYIRGRNIENAYIIIDESQQLLPREAKAAITRVGEHSKIVLTGDPFQVDHQYLDESTNGLSYVIEKFKNQAIAGHAILTKCERSNLASIAADIL